MWVDVNSCRDFSQYNNEIFISIKITNSQTLEIIRMAYLEIEQKKKYESNFWKSSKNYN